MHPLTRFALGIAAASLMSAAACAPNALPGEPGAGVTEDEAEETQRTSAGDGDQDRGLPVAIIGDRVLTTAEFDERLELLSPAASMLYAPAPRRAALLDQFVYLEILANEAVRRGFAGAPWERYLVEEALATGWLSSRVDARVGLASVSASEIQARWSEIEREFNTPEERAFATIVLPDEQAANELLAVIQGQIADRVERPRPIFARFAADRSIDAATRATDGFAGRIVHPDDGGTANRAIADALFALAEPGDIAGPIHTARGWELIQLRSTIEARRVSIEDAQSVIRRELADEHRAVAIRQELDAIAARTTVERDATAIAALGAARVGGELSATRPRRYEQGGLRSTGARVVGTVAAAELVENVAVLHNPNASVAAAPAAPEGSADAAPAPPSPE